MLSWPGLTLKTSVQLNEIKAPVKAGTQVGTLLVTYGEQQQAVPLILSKDLPGADIAWKLTRF